MSVVKTGGGDGDGAEFGPPGGNRQTISLIGGARSLPAVLSLSLSLFLAINLQFTALILSLPSTYYFPSLLLSLRLAHRGTHEKKVALKDTKIPRERERGILFILR